MGHSWQNVFNGESIKVDENEQRVEDWQELTRNLQVVLQDSEKYLTNQVALHKKEATTRTCQAYAWPAVVSELWKTYFPEDTCDDLNKIFDKYLDEEVARGDEASIWDRLRFNIKTE